MLGRLRRKSQKREAISLALYNCIERTQQYCCTECLSGYILRATILTLLHYLKRTNTISVSISPFQLFKCMSEQETGFWQEINSNSGWFILDTFRKRFNFGSI